jgi:hypothetical protein
MMRLAGHAMLTGRKKLSKISVGYPQKKRLLVTLDVDGIIILNWV